MRNLYLLLGLLIITSFKAESRHRFEFLEGKFINSYYGEQIRIKAINGGIKVRGIYGTRGWQRYYLNRGHILRPRDGRSLIEVVGPHRIILKRRRGSKGIHLLRMPLNGHQCHLACCTSYHDGSGRYERRGCNEYNNRYDHKERYYYDKRFNHRDHSNWNDELREYFPDLSSFIGEWYSNELRKLVIIEKSGNERMKARVSGGKQWTEYRFNGRDWIDNRGNTYRLEDSDTMVWKSRDGKEVIRLFRS